MGRLHRGREERRVRLTSPAPPTRTEGVPLAPAPVHRIGKGHLALPGDSPGLFDAVVNSDERSPTSRPRQEDRTAFGRAVGARLGSPLRLDTGDHDLSVPVDALVAHPIPAPFPAFQLTLSECSPDFILAGMGHREFSLDEITRRSYFYRNVHSMRSALEGGQESCPYQA